MVHQDKNIIEYYKRKIKELDGSNHTKEHKEILIGFYKERIKYYQSYE